MLCALSLLGHTFNHLIQYVYTLEVIQVCVHVVGQYFSRTVAVVDTKCGYVQWVLGTAKVCGAALSKNNMFPDF